MDCKKIIVVGAGPAGMIAAIRAAQLENSVTLIEKNSTLGKKLLLSGKGRCNLTNSCELHPFLKKFPKNADFLRDSFKKFFNCDLMRFFEQRGLKLKIERQERVFPVTDRADSVVKVLKEELLKNKVEIIYESAVKRILVDNKRAGGVLFYNGKSLVCDRVILATGGVSYPFTGSTGDGLKMAQESGHRIIPLKPGLVPLKSNFKYIKELEGLTLKNIRLKFSDGKKKVVSEVGELLFTSFGVSGPLVLSLSGFIADWLQKNRKVCLEIDLKPGLTEEQLDARLLREFKMNPRRSLKNTLKALLPLRLIVCFLGVAGLVPDKNTSSITQKERRKIIALLKGFSIEISAARPIEEGMVTRGGVCLKDINPRTMESRLVKGLYFAGEMIDVDADTGGFNLQAAFSTGYLAGESASLN